MVYIMLGAPGSGKGTRAEILKDKFNFVHVSTGSMIRENKQIYSKYEEQLKKGMLLSDELVNLLVSQRLSADDIKNGVIIDGYPRTLKQAKALDGILKRLEMKIEKVFLLVADTKTIYSRILSRTVCSECSKVFTKKEAEKTVNKCPNCGGELVLRTDDNEETLKNRIEIFYENIDEIQKYYEDKGLLETINALDLPEKIIGRI
ncbi:MAG: nucleoside monophosphate kinase [Clostridia bacterium]|nr:nucleoside monophosphate kinase [Clostridia bacterium]